MIMYGVDVSKLKQDSKRQAFINDICRHLDALEHSSDDVGKSWTVFTVHSSAMNSLGPVSRKDWFDENEKRNPETPWRETPKTQGIPQRYQLSIW